MALRRELKLDTPFQAPFLGVKHQVRYSKNDIGAPNPPPNPLQALLEK